MRVEGARPAASARPWRLLLVGCVALAVVSLLGPSQPTYDPWAWIIWGREITEGCRSTRSTAPRGSRCRCCSPRRSRCSATTRRPTCGWSWAGPAGLLAVAMAYRLGSRLAGPWAGGIAALSLLLAAEFIRNFARGNSEGLLVALCLWAVERHLDGRHRDAFLLGFGAALLRPEVWPFFGLYGLWLAWRDPRRRALVGALLRGHGRAVVHPGVDRLGEPAARRRAGPRPEPRLGRVRRGAVRRGLRALLPDPRAAGPRRRRRRARGRMALPLAAGEPRGARLRRRRPDPDGRRRHDDPGRLRRQPALRGAAGGARLRAGGGRLGRPRRGPWAGAGAEPPPAG